MRKLSICAAALLSVGLAGAQNLTGRWTGNANTVDNGQEIVVAINQQGSTITGYVIGPRSTDPIVSGKVEGGTVTLEAERAGRGGGEPQKVTYTAKVEGNKMTLTMPAFGGGAG